MEAEPWNRLKLASGPALKNMNQLNFNRQGVSFEKKIYNETTKRPPPNDPKGPPNS